MIYEEIKLHNPGVLKTKIPDSLFAKIKNDAMNDAIEEKKPYNAHLVGQIEHEYEIKIRPYFETLINNMWLEYRNLFQYHLTDQYYIPNTAWINLQEKHEYNPAHHHDGAVAWVIWVKIPYDLEEELARFPNSKSKHNSLFSFHYNTLIGKQELHHLMIDKSWEGTMVMFPSMLKHSVNPFYTSDATRVSIAGNIQIHG